MRSVEICRITYIRRGLFVHWELTAPGRKGGVVHIARGARMRKATAERDAQFWYRVFRRDQAKLSERMYGQQ